MSYQKRVLCFTMLLFSICILQYGLNDKLTALAYPPETMEKKTISIFEFLEEYDYKIKEVNGLSLNEILIIQKDDTYSAYEIDSYKNISTNELDIDCMEAIDMRRLLDGDSGIRIDYKGKYIGADLKNEETLGLEEDLDRFIKIGAISIYSTKKEPYFRVTNENASIGIGIKDIIIPSKVYELTPVEASDFDVYSNIKHVGDNYVEGSIIIKRVEISSSVEERISLKELKLSENQVIDLKGENSVDSTLEIVKNYMFTIPLNIVIEDDKLIIENTDKGYNTTIKVELPLRYQGKVTHD